MPLPSIYRKKYPVLAQCMFCPAYHTKTIKFYLGYSYERWWQQPWRRANFRLLVLWLPLYWLSLSARKLRLERGAHLPRLSYMFYLPYDYTRVNALCIYLIIIYTPSDTNCSIFRNVSGKFVLVQVYGTDHLDVICCMVFWITVTKVEFHELQLFF